MHTKTRTERFWPILALAVAFTLLAAACGGDGDETAEPQPAVPEAEEPSEAPEAEEPPAASEAPEAEEPAGEATEEAAEPAEAPDASETEEPSDAPEAEEPAEAPEPASVVVAAIPSLGTSPILIADSQGFFADENLTVTYEALRGGPDIIAALNAGEVQIGALAPSPIINAVVNSAAPLQIVGYRYGTSPADAERSTLELFAAPGSGITRPADLEGKAVGTNALGSLMTVAIRQAVINDGADPAEVEFVAVGFPDMVGLLQEGELDAAGTLEPFSTAALNAGLEYVQTLDGEMCSGKTCAIGINAALDSWASQNAGVIERFNRAVERAIDWINEDEARFRAELVSCCNLAEAVASAVAIPTWSSSDSLRADVENLVGVMISQGMIEQAPDSEDLFG